MLYYLISFHSNFWRYFTFSLRDNKLDKIDYPLVITRIYIPQREYYSKAFFRLNFFSRYAIQIHASFFLLH